MNCLYIHIREDIESFFPSYLFIYKKRSSLVNENSSFQNSWWLESKELQMSKNWNFHIFAWPDVKNLDVCQNVEGCNVWK